VSPFNLLRAAVGPAVGSADGNAAPMNSLALIGSKSGTWGVHNESNPLIDGPNDQIEKSRESETTVLTIHMAAVRAVVRAAAVRRGKASDEDQGADRA
jgi:hypothetical protein